MVVLFPEDGSHPEYYVVPTNDWRAPESPLVNPQYPGLKSQPEYGVRLSRTGYEEFQRYRWRGETERLPSAP